MGKVAGLTQYVTSTGAIDDEKKFLASRCKKCGACEKKCPQHIPIIKSLEEVTNRLENFWLKIFLAVMAISRRRRK
jgi:predicted aldo/keto reductase-like oxidoreductase